MPCIGYMPYIGLYHMVYNENVMFIPFGKSKRIHNIGSPAQIQEWINNTYKNHNEKPIIKELKLYENGKNI